MPLHVDEAPEGGPAEVEDRGSFSHGVCRVCGWLGPGRRARRVSHRDAAAHVDVCPGAGRDDASQRGSG